MNAFKIMTLVIFAVSLAGCGKVSQKNRTVYQCLSASDPNCSAATNATTLRGELGDFSIFLDKGLNDNREKLVVRADYLKHSGGLIRIYFANNSGDILATPADLLNGVELPVGSSVEIDLSEVPANATIIAMEYVSPDPAYPNPQAGEGTIYTWGTLPNLTSY